MIDSLRLLAAAVLLAGGTAHGAIVGTISNLYDENLSQVSFAKSSSVPGLPASALGEPQGLAFLDRLTFDLDVPSVVTLRGEVTAGLPSVSMFELLAPPGLVVSRPSPGVVIAEGLLAASDDYVAVLSGDVFGNATYRFVAFAVAAIPEPGTMMLLLAGIVCFGVVIARRR
jgi:hypothetical protein